MKKAAVVICIVLLMGLLLCNLLDSVIVNNGPGHVYRDIHYNVNGSGNAFYGDVYNVDGTNNSIGNVINSDKDELGLTWLTSILEFVASVFDFFSFWN